MNINEMAKILVLGNVDSGKSTFIGVMINNELDNGNGSARNSITNLKHELETGKTSSFKYHYIVENNNVTTLVDLCGHEKYFHTTLFGITALFGDYGILMINANSGIIGTTREHYTLLVTKRIPFIIFITKIDTCPQDKINVLKNQIAKLAKLGKKTPVYIEEDCQLIDNTYITNSYQDIINSFHERNMNIMPIVFVSNKTGHNIPFSKEFITKLRSVEDLERNNMIPVIPKDYSAIMYIDCKFIVKGVGLVFSGTVKYGNFVNGQNIFIGPINGEYVPAKIKTIHNCIRMNVDVLESGDSGSFGIKIDKKYSFIRNRKIHGLVITNDLQFVMAHTCNSFKATLSVFNHSTTIKNGYTPTLHCYNIRQPVKFLMDNDKFLRYGCRENIEIKFVKHPEFILPDSYFVFRDGNTKGIGKIIEIIKTNKKN